MCARGSTAPASTRYSSHAPSDATAAGFASDFIQFTTPFREVAIPLASIVPLVCEPQVVHTVGTLGESHLLRWKGSEEGKYST
jgi:hypothetical protein